MYKKVSGCEVLYILFQTEKMMNRLKRRWNDDDYMQMEECRELAERKGMWFSELRVLLNQARCLLEYHEDRERFVTVLRRIEVLSERFGMEDKEFLDTYRIDGNMERVMGRQGLERMLVDIYDELSMSVDIMASNLQQKIALLLWNAMQKLTLIVEIPVDDRVKGAIQMAVIYGKLQKVEETIQFFDEAMRIATEEGVEMLEYCVLMRKLSWCMAHAHVNECLRIDYERMRVMEMLTEKCEEWETTPRGVGERVLEKGMIEIREAEGEMKRVIEHRMAQVKEAMGIMNLLLSCARGDGNLVAEESRKMEQAENELNGSEGESVVEQINMVYQIGYNSEERMDGEECGQIEWDKENDEPYIPKKPKGCLKNDWVTRLQIQASVEARSGHKDAAEMLCLLSELETNSSYSDYHTAMNICVKSMIAAMFGDDELAIKNYELAEMMLEERDGQETDYYLSPYLYYMLPYHHALLIRKKDTEKAIELMSKAIVNITYKDKMVMMTALFTMHRAEMYWMAGDESKTEKDARESLKMIREEMVGRLQVVDVELKEKIWMIVSKVIEMSVGLLNEKSSEEMRREVYEAVLYAKGFLLSSENAVKRVVYEEKEKEEERALYEEIEAIRNALAPWGTPTDGDAEKYVELYMKETKLMNKIGNDVRKYYDFMDERYDTIRKALGEKEVMMDCFDYEKDGERRYVAFVYGREDEAPRLVRLSLARIEEQIEAERCGVVWFVPSGELHIMPVESKIGHGVWRLSHARNIMNNEGGELESIALFGGLDYGGEDGASDDIRGFLREMNDKRVTPLLPWPELKNTGKEVDSIEFMWKTCINERAEVYRKREGSAERFMSLSGKEKSVIHLATHGFFETKETKGELPMLAETVRPMDLTGVVMSNGNRGWLHGNRLHHEGILLASDIARMDLRGVELVVMSACHSGNGTVKADGVYGLQRALKKAGAKSLVMSLWNEGDEEGCEFMKEFYSRLIGEGMERHQAFEEAKDELKRLGVDEKYWAGFIMID